MAKPSAIFGGIYAKLLKPYLNFFDKAYILTGTDDPMVVATDAPKGSLYMRQNTSGDGQVYKKLDNGSSTNWEALMGSSVVGAVLVDLYDPIAVTLTTGSPVTVDGVVVSDGDIVLFPSLSLNPGIYEAAVSGGNVTSWTYKNLFPGGSFTPSNGHAVRITSGTMFGQQLAVYDGNNYYINDIVRYFDGPQGTNHWEQTSLKSFNINNNTTEQVFEIATQNSENIIIDFSVLRDDNKNAGTIYITDHADKDPSMVVTSADIDDTGVTFAAERSWALTGDETWNNVSQDVENWRSVTWSPTNNRFVAVAAGGINRVKYSADGNTWNNATATSSTWNSVTWSDAIGRFVAVGIVTSPKIIYSADGITWTNATTNPSVAWNSVTSLESASRFVAVGESGTNLAMYSSDGDIWTTVSVAASTWKCVTKSESLTRLVAVAASGPNQAMYSSDGISWTNSSSVPAGWWHSVCWSEELGIFVAVANFGPNYAMYSSDGDTWTLASSAQAGAWKSVIWVAHLGQFVAVSDGGANSLMVSRDGNTWTAIDGISANDLQNIAWSEDLLTLIAVADGGTNRITYLDDFIPKIRVSYTSDNSGPSGSLKYSMKRWSDGAGGPSGPPQYTSLSGSSIAAAGSPTEVQFHGGGGNLDSDPDFRWDNGALELGNLEIHKLTGPLTVLNNQTAAVLFSFAATYRHAVIDYSLERDGDYRTGTIFVANNGTIAEVTDQSTETASLGITFDADISAGNVRILYDSTNTGFNASFSYSIRRWS